MSKTVLAWHFVNDRLRDGRPIPADGVELRHDGPVGMCRSGLHASRSVRDALGYAPGATLCRVEMREVVDEDDDKLVARSRTILWRIDAEPVLRQFARDCALEVLHLWDAPDVVVEYLLTGDESLRDAAWAAARDAAWDAARDAAWAAARAAAGDAARDAAWAAARDAAWDAAWAAARDAAWAAARDAAWDAAWAAARDAARAHLEVLALVAHGAA
jgi:hypothetical protein